MTINCFDNTYKIKYTDSRKGTISIPKKALIADLLDIALVGKNRLEYGQVFDENILHLLENFAALESTITPHTPDLVQTYGDILSKPTQGQTWYNLTRKRHYVFNGTKWLPLGTNNDVSGNRGVIAHGMQLPLPISLVTGVPFTYADCSWNVSPFSLPLEVDYMECFTDSNATLTMRYTPHGSGTIVNGYANYQIIAIKDNHNGGFNTPVPPTGTILPTVTPTPTPSITPTHMVTPTVTPTVTPIAVSPTPVITPGVEYYVYATVSDDLSTGRLVYGAASASGFTDIATNLVFNDSVNGDISSNNQFLFVPQFTNGLQIYGRFSSLLGVPSLETVTSIPIPAPYAHCMGSVYVPANGSIQAKLFVLYITNTGMGSESYGLYSYAISSAGLATQLEHGGNPIDSGSYQNIGLCRHNNYVLVIAGNKIEAYNHGLFTTLRPISTKIISTQFNNYGAVSDGNYIYIESSYLDTSSKTSRMIFTFFGSTFTQVLNESNTGEVGAAVGDGFTFTGLNFESAIQARSWDGTTLSSVIATISSQVPNYQTLFKYSATTNRLYNPIDNNPTLSKIYSWNGTTFNIAADFSPETDTSLKYTGFNLIPYLNDSGVESGIGSGIGV